MSPDDDVQKPCIFFSVKLRIMSKVMLPYNTFYKQRKTQLFSRNAKEHFFLYNLKDLAHSTIIIVFTLVGVLKC